MWRRVLSQYKGHPALANTLALLQIVLAIPVQTATLERGFSLMKQSKTDWRNRLSPNTLLELLMIKLNGPDIDHFDPMPATNHKVVEGRKRSCRPDKQCQLDDEITSESDSEAEI